jgi:hypothetical protein
LVLSGFGLERKPGSSSDLFGFLSSSFPQVMSITVHLDLPEALVKEARANGLLESASMSELLETELRRRKAAAELNVILEGIRAQPGEAMSDDEIQAEVRAARKERRAREASPGH